ncbi:MAG: DUF4272 domain-containing protein [Coriobacteriia bacterium]|nr:DUF4272 domain-containing protein [Coriobacteriia bacterium]
MLQQYKQAADAIRGSLETSGVWKHTTLDERQFFTAGLTGRSQQQLVDSSWAVESLSCCLWAMSLLPEMPGFDQESDPAIAKLLPPSAETLALRSGDELEKARSVAELWHWRSRTRQLIESGQSIPALPDGMTLDEVVRLTSEAAAKAGDLRDVCDGDFCAFGKPYRSISAEEYSHATSIAAERHKALNWICGMAPKNDWSLTPTDT